MTQHQKQKQKPTPQGQENYDPGFQVPDTKDLQSRLAKETSKLKNGGNGQWVCSECGTPGCLLGPQKWLGQCE